MLTPSHGLIAWIVGKRLLRSRPEMVKFLVLGSLLADAFMIVCGTYWFLTQGRHPWDIYLDIFIPAWVNYPTRILHSLIVIIPIFILATIWGRSFLKIKAILTGWLIFHIGVDFITHELYGHEHFWPISNYKFIGFSSDENVYFFIVDCILSVTAILIFGLKILRYLRQQTQKTFKQPD